MDIITPKLNVDDNRTASSKLERRRGGRSSVVRREGRQINDFRFGEFPSNFSQKKISFLEHHGLCLIATGGFHNAVRSRHSTTDDDTEEADVNYYFHQRKS